MPKSIPTSIWLTGQQTSAQQRKRRYLAESTAHPGKMLPEIARYAINAYTQPGDIVVDPMCGIGTTLVEAIHLGRNAFGTEYEKRWTQLANDNVTLAKSQGAEGKAFAVNDDGRNIDQVDGGSYIGKVALVITSPPYGSSLHGQVSTGEKVNKSDSVYSHDRSNLGYASTEVLLESFADILRSCAKLLRPGGVIAITTRPWRQNGLLVDLPSAVGRLAGGGGLELFERNIALIAGVKNDELIGRPSFFQLNYVRKSRQRDIPLNVISHEDVIVMRKPVEK